MRNPLPLAKKEVRSYFNSPIAYITVIVFLLFMSIWFFFIHRFAAQNTASLRGYFGILPAVFTVLVPALTMRSWAEERKMGTAELLLTLPYTEAEIVISKFLGSLFLLVLMLVLTLPLPLTISSLGHFETGEIIGEYIGMVLLGSAALAVGQFVSALSSNQVSSFIFGVLVLLFFTLIHNIGTLGDLPSSLSSLFSYLSLDSHFQSFRRGVLDSRDFAYFLLLSGLFLYLTVKVLILRKWR